MTKTKKIDHAPIRDIERERELKQIIDKIINDDGLSQNEKQLAIESIEKQIRKTLIHNYDANIIRYQCPTCGHMYWMKSMLSCEHCGQLLMYKNGDSYENGIF